MIKRVDKKNNVGPPTGDEPRMGGLRSGGPSMTAPGTGRVRKAAPPKHAERWVQPFADAINTWTGEASEAPIQGT